MLEAFKIAEVDEQAELETRGLQVVEDLGFVFGCKGGKGFGLNDDLPVTDKIGEIALDERLAFVDDGKRFFLFKWDSRAFEFDSKSFLVDAFKIAGTKCVVNLHATPNDLISFFFENQVHAIIRSDSFDSLTIQPRSASFVQIRSIR